jgi:hypothetical protein
VDVQCEREPLADQSRELEKAPQRMCLLAVANPVMLDPAVSAPVGNRRQRVVFDPICNGPALHHDRRQRVDPLVTGRRDMAADGRVVCVPIEADVLTLYVPELVEDGVEVEVDADRRPLEDLLVPQHSGDVDEHVVVTAGRIESERPAQVAEVRFSRGSAHPGIHHGHLIAQSLEPEHVLEHGPCRATLVWVSREHARDQDLHAGSASR